MNSKGQATVESALALTALVPMLLSILVVVVFVWNTFISSHIMYQTLLCRASVQFTNCHTQARQQLNMLLLNTKINTLELTVKKDQIVGVLKWEFILFQKNYQSTFKLKKQNLVTTRGL